MSHAQDVRGGSQRKERDNHGKEESKKEGG